MHSYLNAKKTNYILMKSRLLFIIFIISCVQVHAQVIVENPSFGLSTAGNVHIEKVEINDTATIISCHTRFTPGQWIRVPDYTYIQPGGSEKQFSIVTTVGIPFNEEYFMPESGEVRYSMIFPPVDPETSSIDYGEGSVENGWFIFDIMLKPGEMKKSIIPENIKGNWFRGDNGQWEISFLDSKVVYKSQIWQCSDYSLERKTGKMKMENGNKKLDIFFQQVNDSIFLIGESSKDMARYSSKQDEKVIPVDNTTFTTPLPKYDTITYKGYIVDFDPRLPNRTGMAYVNDVLLDDQTSHLIKIEDDGSFEIKFPHANPQVIFFSLPFFLRKTVFLEPGKTLFHMMKKDGYDLFMGDNARINSELVKIPDIISWDIETMMSKILDFSPEQYKEWCLSLLETDMKELSQNIEKRHISAKTIQIKELELILRYTNFLMSYEMDCQSAYRYKNNIPRNESSSYTAPKPNSNYYSFLTAELVNNPLNFLTSSFSTFVNRINIAIFCLKTISKALL